MAGVALFDELLRDAKRRAFSDDELEQSSMNIDGALRCGQPLSDFALPFLAQVMRRPQLARGFAAALGDYVGMLQEGSCPADGEAYTLLKYEHVLRVAADEPPASNVVQLFTA